VDYWFVYSDDSSAGSYDPTRECFVVVVDDQANGANAAGAGDGEAHQNSGNGVSRAPGLSVPPTSPARGADINAQLAQARELEAKLAEEYRAVRASRLHRWRSFHAQRMRARAGQVKDQMATREGGSE
jgi:hypothetical protein